MERINISAMDNDRNYCKFCVKPTLNRTLCDNCIAEEQEQMAQERDDMLGIIHW